MRKQDKAATGSTAGSEGSGDKDVTQATATMGEKEPSAADSAKTNLLVLNEASQKLIFL